jgi:GDP/UDP-N,N'-diacetylbacillosamine 2-epimerase (hydrolysing)
LKEGPITVITSTRADWGLLRPVCLGLLSQDKNFRLIVTGSHLDRAGDRSITEIDAEFKGHIETLDILQKSNEGTEPMFQALSNAIPQYEQVLRRIKPRLMIMLGDRYEIMAMAWVCRLLGVPVAHFSGGELTLGAFDDAMRHCITKLSDFHFVSTDEHYRRVRQLGENPEHIFNVGELAFAGLAELKLKSAHELKKEFSFDFTDYFLATVHPETCRVGQGLEITKNIIKAVAEFSPDSRLLFTAANLDPEGLEINNFLMAEENRNPSLKFIRSLGRLNYLSAAQLCTCVLGNSSSGVLEIPALGVPSINIGNRQKGRVQDSLVTNSDPDLEAIIKALRACAPFTKRSNIDANSSAEKAVKILLQLEKPAREKPFYDLFP